MNLIFRIVLKTSEKISKIDPQDFITQDTIKDVIEIIKEVIKP